MTKLRRNDVVQGKYQRLIADHPPTGTSLPEETYTCLYLAHRTARSEALTWLYQGVWASLGAHRAASVLHSESEHAGVQIYLVSPSDAYLALDHGVNTLTNQLTELIQCGNDFGVRQAATGLRSIGLEDVITETNAQGGLELICLVAPEIEYEDEPTHLISVTLMDAVAASGGWVERLEFRAAHADPSRTHRAG